MVCDGFVAGKTMIFQEGIWNCLHEIFHLKVKDFGPEELRMRVEVVVEVLGEESGWLEAHDSKRLWTKYECLLPSEEKSAWRLVSAILSHSGSMEIHTDRTSSASI